MMSQTDMIKRINAEITKLQNKRERIISKVQSKCKHPENLIREQPSKFIEGDGYFSMGRYVPSRRICLECGKLESGPNYKYLLGQNIPTVSEKEFDRIFFEKKELYYG